MKMTFMNIGTVGLILLFLPLFLSQIDVQDDKTIEKRIGDIMMQPFRGWSTDESTTSEKAYRAPKFCHGIDCPKYTVGIKTDKYEERHYESTKWASTIITGMDLDKATSTGFLRLFAYISGENEAKSKIPMTAPVKNLITPGQGPFCESNFTISFFVPFAFQDSTPEPITADVFLTSEPATTFYVSQFGGYAKESKLLEKAAELADSLVADGVSFQTANFINAGYDPPFRPVNRHNEIWYKQG